MLLRRNSIQALFKGYYYDKHNHQAATPSTKQNSVLVDSLSKDVDKELEIPAEENVDDDEESTDDVRIRMRMVMRTMRMMIVHGEDHEHDQDTCH